MSTGNDWLTDRPPGSIVPDPGPDELIVTVAERPLIVVPIGSRCTPSGAILTWPCASTTPVIDPVIAGSGGAPSTTVLTRSSPPPTVATKLAGVTAAAAHCVDAAATTAATSSVRRGPRTPTLFLTADLLRRCITVTTGVDRGI